MGTGNPYNEDLLESISEDHPDLDIESAEDKLYRIANRDFVLADGSEVTQEEVESGDHRWSRELHRGAVRCGFQSRGTQLQGVRIRGRCGSPGEGF